MNLHERKSVASSDCAESSDLAAGASDDPPPMTLDFL